MKKTFLLLVLVVITFFCCSTATSYKDEMSADENTGAVKVGPVKPGIYSLDIYGNILKDKRIAVVANQTSVIENTHLVDTLLSLNYNIVKVFSPEHGFRGDAEAGKLIDNSIDHRTGLPIISLYGKNKKPYNEQMKDFDIMLFDLQDVGVRFYTYISTLHYVMESCAENDIPLIVLDRPNPNAHYIDGPVLDTSKFRSFIGMHPVPAIYGMTIGEYGMMINGENWLNNGLKCDLEIIPCRNYSHQTSYSLPVSPSPNLPNERSIELYPTLCYFEGTSLSIGRGTGKQFQIIGHPLFENVKEAGYTFTPAPNQGSSDPALNGKLCYGFDLSEDDSIFEIKDQLNISLLKKVYELFPDKDQFFKKSNFFELLAGNSEFRQQIIDNIDEKNIRKSWEKDLHDFKEIRSKYLLYK